MAKMCAAESLCLQEALTVVGALESVVKRCVGPEGGSVLFIKDTGEMLITRHGQRILTSLRLDHPIARTVLDCVTAHDRVTADGSKSFILLLAALLRGIRNSMSGCKQMSRNPAAVRKLASQLLAFSCNELDTVIARSVVPYAARIEQVDEVLPALIAGYLAGRVDAVQAAVMTPLLCELYRRVCKDDDRNAYETITFLHSNFPLLNVGVSGLPSSCSCVVEGLVLACDWPDGKETEGPVKALVVCESLDPPCDPGIRISFHEDWLTRSECLVQERLERILHLQVKLLLSSVKQSGRVMQWAQVNDISLVQCCDSAQLDLLCMLTATEVHPLHPPLRITTLSTCRRLQVGGCRYANVGIPLSESLHTYTLVLCAPTPGVLEQSVSVSRGVYRMLQHLTQTSPRMKEQPNETISINDSHVYQLQRDNEPTPLLTQKPQCFQSQGLASSLNFWERFVTAGRVVPVGGAFEVLLHHSLSRCNNYGDSKSQRLLAEAVLSIPKSLHSHRPRSFLQHHASIISALQPKKTGILTGEAGSEFTLGLATKGSLWVEPVCSKYHLVASVLQCVNRLLSVGCILHTHSSLNKTGTVDSNEGDDENTSDGPCISHLGLW